MPKADSELLTPGQAAHLLGISPVTLRIWARTGKLPALTTAGGHRRFDPRDVSELARRQRRPDPTSPPSPLRILVVEDDRQFATFVTEALMMLAPPPTLDTAYDGFEAGRLFQRFQPDLVLLDLMLPGIDGFALCRRLRNEPVTSHVRVIAMTGYDSPENRARILEAGAETCLTKPFRTAALLAAVREAGSTDPVRPVASVAG